MPTQSEILAMSEEDQEPWRVVYHEAGHIAVGMYFGATLKEYAINLEASDMKFDPDVPECEKIIKVALAGQISQEKLLKRSATEVQLLGDDEKMHMCLDFYAKHYGKTHEQIKEEIKTNTTQIVQALWTAIIKIAEHLFEHRQSQEDYDLYSKFLEWISDAEKLFLARDKDGLGEGE